MALSHSEHFEIIKAVLESAKTEGFYLYIDGMVPDDETDMVLNLWDSFRGRQLDFPEDIWSYN